MIIIDTEKQTKDELRDKIADLEKQAIYGPNNKSALTQMKLLTEEYLRITHPTLKSKQI